MAILTQCKSHIDNASFHQPTYEHLISLRMSSSILTIGILLYPAAQERIAEGKDKKKRGERENSVWRQTYFPSLSRKISFDWLLSGRGPWWLQLCRRAKEGNTQLFTFSVKTSFAQMVSF